MRVLALVAVLFTGLALFAENPISQTEVALPSETPHTLGVGLNLFYFDYREEVPLPLKSTESAFLPGVSAAHIYRSGSGFHWENRADSAFGGTIYDGSYMNGAPAKGDTNNRVLRLETRLGYEMVRGSALGMTPYVGIGFHYWDRDLSPTPGGYREQYLWYNAPVGVALRYQASESFHLGLDASLRFNLGGNLSIGSGAINSKEISANLGSAVGFRLEAPLRFRVNSGFSILVSPYLEESNIGKGDPTYVYTALGVASIHEPASTAHLYGIRVMPTFAL